MGEETTVTRIARFEVDPRTLARATELQRAEWRVLLDELAGEEVASASGASVLVLERTEQFARVRLEREDGTVATTVDLASSTMTSLYDEYVGIVRMMMDQELPLPRLEALDMAKKVVHDRAARTLRAELADLDARIEGLRRLFSLVVALRVEPRDIRATRRHG